MASRREQRRQTGFYRRLNRFSTADEWNVLSQSSTVRRWKKEVFEVEAIVGERKRKVREFPFAKNWERVVLKAGMPERRNAGNQGPEIFDNVVFVVVGNRGKSLNFYKYLKAVRGRNIYIYHDHILFYFGERIILLSSNQVSYNSLFGCDVSKFFSMC